MCHDRRMRRQRRRQGHLPQLLRQPIRKAAIEMTQPSEADYLWQKRFDVLLRVRMNRIYQQRRQALMESREGFVKVSSLIAGSAAIAKVTSPEVIAACVAVIFSGTASALVFNWGNKGRDAARRVGEWTSLEREIELVGERDFTEAQVNQWTSRCNEIESSEPEPNKWLLEKAYVRACETLGAKPSPAETRPIFSPFIP